MNLGNTYKTFAEIKSRKNDQTKFIDSLKQGLLKKVNTDDSEVI
ncbi:MAG: RteC domain-containing protein [Gelidibacter sp.]